jgi:hypothetical protein
MLMRGLITLNIVRRDRGETTAITAARWYHFLLLLDFSQAEFFLDLMIQDKLGSGTTHSNSLDSIINPYANLLFPFPLEPWDQWT